jgi:uncharacterized heparinase superfamily protein
LVRQLPAQILGDGGHYERSPAYHCQVLADLIDVADLLRATDRRCPDELNDAVARMRRWLGAVITPDGQVPLRGDGYPVPPELIAVLEPTRPPTEPLAYLADSGLVRATTEGWHLLADVGEPCPADLPAHAHADTLNCLLHVDGRAFLVDTGTSTYANGRVRDYERSTIAHNTVQVDGVNSTEVWGAFRAARRARIRAVSAGQNGDGYVITAEHDGYRRLPGRPKHRRHWHLTDAALTVEDEITGSGTHDLAMRWHIAPSARVEVSSDQALVHTERSTMRLTVEPPGLTLEHRPKAAGFGRTVDAPVLVHQITATLPARIVSTWQRGNRREPS